MHTVVDKPSSNPSDEFGHIQQLHMTVPRYMLDIPRVHVRGRERQDAIQREIGPQLRKILFAKYPEAKKFPVHTLQTKPVQDLWSMQPAPPAGLKYMIQDQANKQEVQFLPQWLDKDRYFKMDTADPKDGHNNGFLEFFVPDLQVR